MDIFNYITYFSQDIVCIIVSYIDKEEVNRLNGLKHMINKELYTESPGIERVNKYNYENYIRWIIRNDLSYLFLFSIKKITFVGKKRIKYKNIVFKSYIDYIKYLINSYSIWPKILQ